ncbi:hypothetical protein BDQ17DRAFT_1543765 [Cyathus striatus]|nr:hypothetical protein BDQ17DRAFT_1543765 [Cyathus striatus]
MLRAPFTPPSPFTFHRHDADTSLTSGSGSNNNISGNTGSSSTTPTPTSASVSEGRFDSVYDYPYTAPRRQGEPLVAGPVTSSARQANPRIGSGAESGAWGMTASSYVPTVRNYYWSIADDRERERRVEFDADGVERRRREGDLDLEFLERERRREMERETQRGREGGREGEGDRRDVIPGEGDFAAHLNTALRRLREETSLFTEVVGMELTRERERGRERDRERERETGQRGRDGVGPPRIPPLPSLMHSGRDMSPLFASTPTSTERDETVSTNATRASSSASTARTSTGHHRSDSLDSLGLSMEVPFDGPLIDLALLVLDSVQVLKGIGIGTGIRLRDLPLPPTTTITLITTLL